MARKRKEDPPKGSPAWMATFSDLMNLLLCFFVLLFASSNMDEEKIRRIMASFNQASFSVIEAGAVSLIEGQIVSGGVTQLPGIESILEYIGVSSEVEGDNQDLSATGSVNEDGKNDKSETDENLAENQMKEEEPQEDISEQELKKELQEQGLKQSEEMYDEISQMTESYKIDDRIVMDYNSQYVSLDLNGAVLFDPGKAEIRDDVKVFMQKIATIMSKYKDCVIEIEGHTDNVPISTSNFESNRYLSTARANKVYEYVMEQASLKDENVKIAGYGESRPVASNETEEGRAKNRRVSIKIYNRLNSDVQQ